MSNVEEGLFQMEATEQYGDAIPVEVHTIFALAGYHSAWIDADFYYEQPRTVLALDTAVGEIHAEFRITGITDGNLYELLTEHSAPGEGELDIRDLQGEPLYMAPRDDYNFATLGLSPEVQYNADRNVHLVEPGAIVSEDEDALQYKAYENRSVEWLNRQLQVEYERHVSAYGGWLERPIDSVVTADGTVSLRVEVADDWQARWEFDDSFKGHLQMREFTEHLGLPADIDELEDSLVYIHPVHNLHHSLPRTEYPRDALERWVISRDPHAPEQDNSLLSRIRSYFTSPTIEASIEPVNQTRNARSSDAFDVFDAAREPTPEQATEE